MKKHLLKPSLLLALTLVFFVSTFWILKASHKLPTGYGGVDRVSEISEQFEKTISISATARHLLDFIK